MYEEVTVDVEALAFLGCTIYEVDQVPVVVGYLTLPNGFGAHVFPLPQML